MAWRQLPDNSYIQTTAVVHGYVGNDPTDGTKFRIFGTLASGEVLIVSPLFNSSAAAQTALDNFIAATGGTV